MNTIVDSILSNDRAGTVPTSPTGHALRAQQVVLPSLDGGATDGRAMGFKDGNPLHHVKTRVQVCVGEAEITVGELLGAREHQVIALNRTVDQPVDILLEGKVIARGSLVAVDDQFAVRITELPVSLKS